MAKLQYVVYNENWETVKKCKTLEEAKAYRERKYGFAGYIIAINQDGEEVANYS